MRVCNGSTRLRLTSGGGAERQRRAGANSHFGDGATRIPAFLLGSAAAPSRHHRCRRSSDAQVQRMIAELASRPTLSTDVMRRVSERAGGVPLFVEEVSASSFSSAASEGLDRPFRRTCASRWRRASTGWGRRAKSRRSGRCWAGASPMPFCVTFRPTKRRRVRDSMKPRCNPPWRVSRTQVFCSSMGFRRR